MAQELSVCELALDDTTATVVAAIGCFMIVANGIAEQEPEHAALLRALSRRLVAKIPSDALEDIVAFVAEVVRDVSASKLPAAAKAH